MSPEAPRPEGNASVQSPRLAVPQSLIGFSRNTARANTVQLLMGDGRGWVVGELRLSGVSGSFDAPLDVFCATDPRADRWRRVGFSLATVSATSKQVPSIATHAPQARHATGVLGPPSGLVTRADKSTSGCDPGR